MSKTGFGSLVTSKGEHCYGQGKSGLAHRANKLRKQNSRDKTTGAVGGPRIRTQFPGTSPRLRGGKRKKGYNGGHAWWRQKSSSGDCGVAVELRPGSWTQLCVMPGGKRRDTGRETIVSGFRKRLAFRSSRGTHQRIE